jgi:hypothetical protein
LKGLDPNLLFTVVVAAKGHVAELKERVDPRGGSLELKLLPHGLDRRPPSLIVSGRVVDEDGKPVADATVKPSGYTAKGYKYGGVPDGADRLAITDERGSFQLGLTRPIDALYVTVTAAFLAPRQSGPLRVGPAVNEISLVRGVTVSGKVVKGEKPLAGVTLRLSQTLLNDAERKRDRSIIPMSFEIDTDSRGNFEFQNVPPDDDYVLIGLMESVRSHGALAARAVAVKGNLTTLDLGTWPVLPGTRLSGRVVLADGKTVARGTEVYLTRIERATHDQQLTTTDAEGRFAFAGVPDDLLQLSCNVKGYRVSARNYSYDTYFGYGLQGRVGRDISGLRLLLEPGKFVVKPVGDREAVEFNRRQQSQMQGAPP